MKNIIYFVILCLIVFVTYAKEKDKNSIDNEKIEVMRTFDYPFLIGVWTSEERVSPKGNSYNLKMVFASDYSYSLMFYRNNELISYDAGSYEKTEKKINLTSLAGDVKTYNISNTNKELSLNETKFSKMISPNLIGEWQSKEQRNKLGLKINSLLLSPNYSFFVEFEKDGKKMQKIGLYVIEQDRIMFFYENGQNIGKYKLTENSLEIDMEHGDMHLIMKRTDV